MIKIFKYAIILSILFVAPVNALTLREYTEAKQIWSEDELNFYYKGLVDMFLQLQNRQLSRNICLDDLAIHFVKYQSKNIVEDFMLNYSVNGNGIEHLIDKPMAEIYLMSLEHKFPCRFDWQ